MATKHKLEAPKEIGETATLALVLLSPNPANRKLAHDEDIKTLAASIKEVGLLHPILVEPHPDKPKEYRIIAGERRYRALKRLGIEAAPCVIVSDDPESGSPSILGVVENHQRRALTPMEEAAAVRALLDQGLETEAVARSLGRSRAWVSRRSSLTELSERWLAELADPKSRFGVWPPSHLELVARFPADVQDRMLDDWKASWYSTPTLRDLQMATGEYQRLIAGAPWKPDDDTLCPEAGACALCPKRSSHHPDLFDLELEASDKTAKGDRCLDPNCWNTKSRAYLKRRVEEVEQSHPGALLLANMDEETEDVPIQEEWEDRTYHASQVTLCRKSDANALPALIVSGPGLGRIKWVQGNEPEPPLPTNGVADSGAETEPEPESQEMAIRRKRESYDRRRRQVVIEAVRERLSLLTRAKTAPEALDLEGGRALTVNGLTAKTLVLLHALLSEYGWKKSSHFPLETSTETLPWEMLSELPNHGLGPKEMREELLQLVWSLLRLALHTLASRLVVEAAEKTNNDHFADAERVSALFGFDFAALRHQAAEKIPYAKAWREEIEDDWRLPGSSEGEPRAATNGKGHVPLPASASASVS